MAIVWYIQFWRIYPFKVVEMKLSDGEKLMLLMLCDLHEKIDVENGMEPEFVRSAILDDQLWAIDWKYSGIPFEKSTKPKHVSEILDILNMWWIVERSYKQLEDSGRQSLKESLNHETLPEFDGFDGNHETECMIVCEYLIEKLGTYGVFKERKLNSHCQRLEKYRAMVKVFKRASFHNNLELEQIREILLAPYPHKSARLAVAR